MEVLPNEASRWWCPEDKIVGERKAALWQVMKLQ
jgi:hypothetical protein